MTVNPNLPVSVSVAASANPVCSGTSVTFTATPTNGGASPTYQWRLNGANVGTNSTTYSYAPTNNDVVTCVLTSNAICATGNPATSNTVTMTVTTQPVATFSYVASPYCSNATNPSPTFSGGGVAGTFSSTAGLVFVSTATGQINLASSTAGTYTVTNTIAASGGCAAVVANTTITISSMPTAVISGTASVCLNAASPTITFTGSGSVSPYTFTYSINGGSNQTITTISGNSVTLNVPTSTAGTFVYSLIDITSSINCSQTQSGTATITVRPDLTITDDAPAELCQYNLQMVTASVAGGSGNYSYLWQVTTAGASNLFVPGATTNNFIWLTGYVVAAGTYNYQLTVTDLDWGCQKVKNFAIDILPNLSPNWVLHPSSVCSGQTGVVYSVQTVAGATYFWDVTGGIIASGQGTSQIIVDWGSSAGTGNVALNATLGSCSQSFSQSVTINALPTITLGSNPSVCSGTTLANLPYTATTGSPNRYSIDFDASANTAGFIDVTNLTLTGTPIVITIPVGAAPNTYSGVLTVKNNLIGCVSINYPISITINPLLTVGISIAASATTVCTGTNVTFTATPTNGGSTPSYQWNVNGNNVGINSSTYSFVPVNNDAITCILTSGATCTTGNPATSNAITMTVNSLIGNNSLDNINGVHGVLCTTTGENSNSVFNAPAGTYFINVGFASYGTPNGTCPAFTLGGCNSITSQSVTEGYLLGNNSATIPATNTVFGDPCVGTLKRLYILTTYTEPICAGSIPATISGSLPTGGNGTYVYLWESSTIGPLGGFSAASGTNNLQDYAPGVLTQTTWYRRTVTSGVCSNTSAVILIKVTPVIAGNTITSSQTICSGTTPVTLTGSIPTGGINSYIYLWESSITSASTGFTPAIGINNGQNYSPGALTQTTWYRRSVTSGGCSNSSSALQITVTPMPVATFSYAASPYCSNGTNPSPTFSGGGVAGTFSSTAGLVFVSSATGQINLASSTAGVYTVTNTIAASGGCAVVVATNMVTITSLPAATISYAGTPFCKSISTAQSVTRTGTAGGTYSASPAGLIIDGSTGAITPSTSTAGSYTVTYTIAAAGGCAVVTATTSVTITAVPTATISYAGSPFCTSVSTAQAVTLSGTGAYSGGVFSSTAGLSMNTSTGAITPSTSTAGTYTVTYTIPSSGGCAAVPVTTSVTITALPVATFSYAASPYCSNATNPSPTFSGGGVAGTFSSTAGLVFVSTTTGQINLASSTAGVYTVTNTIAASGGCAVVVATNTVTITALPTATISYPGTPFCKSISTSQSVTRTGTAGGIYSASPAGLSIDGSTGAITPSTSAAGNYTVTYTIAASGGCAVVTATTAVTITDVPTAVISYAGSPFCTSVSTAQAVTLSGTGAYTGGVFSSTAGLTMNPSTGEITPSTSTAGTYTVTYTIPSTGGCAAVPVTTSVTITALPVATFSYAASPYCSNATNPSPTFSGGGVAGTFSSTAGLVFVSSATGQINLASSTAGVYTVTNTIAASGGCGLVVATSQVTITALPAATISYSGTPFCKSISTAQAVTQAGTAGGTYSASPAGLTIDGSTGAITPSTSTAGSYTVTYTIAASGGCAIVTATTSVTITDVPTAMISYAGSPFCTSVSTAQPPTLSGTGAYAGGVFSSTAGLTISSWSGEITPSTSTTGTYTVTYTIPATGGCAAVPVTTTVTITTLPVATFSYAASPYCSNATNPSPTFSGGGVAGTFSSTAGLVFVSAATGELDLTTSTPGAYIVTNTIEASGGCEQVIATSSVTITTLPAATISYSSASYFTTDPIQDVLLTGTFGGVFSAQPAGLEIDATTGQISPSLSSSGVYVVTYTIAASGGCAEVTATTGVTIVIGGIITVSGSTGADGSYASLTNSAGAFAALNSQDQTGNSIEVTIEGNSIFETGTNSLNAGNWIALTLFPAIPDIEIKGNVAGPLLNLNGCDNVTIDGRVDLTGTSELTITNTSSSSSANTSTIRFIGSAENNTIQYCTIKGSETSTTSGIINFSTSTSGNGNDGNVISNNTISSDIAGRPINAIYSSGTSGSENSGNTISDNSIFDFLNPASASNGINISSNSTAWTISGNSFYETSTFTPSAWVEYNIIRINNTSGVNFAVTDNSIGGSSDLCGGAAWTKTNSINNAFNAIYMNVGTSTPSSVQNNTIKNLSWSNSGAATWTGINIAAGNVNIGTITGNTIGATTGTGSVIVTAGDSPPFIYGINISSTGVVNCQNNNIGSITTANTNGTRGTHFYGINKTAVAGTTTISNNFIGSGSTANSIQASSGSTANIQNVVGINSDGTGITTISGNTVLNLTNSQTIFDGASQTIGIQTSAGSNTIQDNTVGKIRTGSAQPTTAALASAIGIAQKSTTAGTTQTVNGNTVYEISNINATARVDIYGIYYVGPTSGNNSVSGNFIHSLMLSSSNLSADMDGIVLFGGLTTCANNIINLGVGVTNGYLIYGIWDEGQSTNNNNIYFNTVYIGGTVTTATTSTTCALWNNNNTSTRNYRNNLLTNSRTGGTTGKHYAIRVAGTTNLTIDYNDYYATGTNGVLGMANNTECSTLALFRTATGQDVNSVNLNPGFSNAGGTSATDYMPSSIILVGTYINSVTTDYSGNFRLATPTIGALEGSLVLNVDVYKSGVFQSTYFRVKDAFDKINNGTHTGTLDVRIKANTIETASAVLYQSGYNGTSNYTSVNIFPTTTGISVTGNLNAPLIDFNSADNVTLDGRVNASGTTNSLVVTNTNTGTSASTIRFINSAENNTVKYCTIKGSGINTSGGVIFFSTANAGNGNDGNTIINNNITGDAAGRPINAIYSFGSAGYENSSITISNNNIYDFLKHGTASNGVNLNTNTTSCSVNGNSFYETTNYIPTEDVNHTIILISNASGVNFTVSNNYIGGKASQCGGAPWTKTNAKNNAFTGIGINAGTATSSNIDNNTIQNISWSNSNTATWTGISVIAGNVNLGTSVGNTVGATTGTSSINITSGNSTATVYGINLAGTGTVVCQNNTIGSITANNDATKASNLYGINKTNTAGTITISNNLIGSITTANSINASSASTSSAQSVFGICTNGTGTVTISNNTIANLNNGTTNPSNNTRGLINGIKSTNGTNSISNNTIYNLSIANRNTSTTNTASVCGIVLTGTSLKTVSGNTIYNLTNSNSSFAGGILGLYFTGNTGANMVSGNFIHSLSVTGASSTTASIFGIKIAAGVTTFYNNIINLGGNTKTTLYGIFESGTSTNNNNLYFNTVYIGGSLVSGSNNKSYALYSSVSTNVRNFRDNIFVNARSTASGTNLHYAAYFNYGSTSNITINYNDYYISGTGGVLGYHNGNNKTTLPIITGQDANSMVIDPVFAIAGGTNPTNYIPNSTLPGITISTISIDFASNPRAATPTIGAWEGTRINKWKGTISNAWNIAGNWTENYVPTIDANIFFDDVPLNHCQLDQNRSVTNITNAQGTYRMVTNGNKLTIKGNLNFTNGAQIDATANNSTVEFAGFATQTIPAGTFYTNQAYNLTVNNSNNLTLNGPLNITGVVTAQTGNLFSGGNLTLISTAAQTALISGSGTGEVLGNVTMQRYLPSAFGYKYFGTPFQAATVNEFADDMDLTASFPTFYDYDENNFRDSLGVSLFSTGWVKYVTNTNPLIPMKGYAVNFGAAAAAKTVTMTGVVNNNISSTRTLFNHNRTYTKGFNLIGNPYPSPIDWNAASGWTKTNFDNAIYFFDSGDTNQYWGTYSTYINGISSNGIASPIIPSMQGFFVHVSNGSFPVTALFGMNNQVRVNNLTPTFHKSAYSETRPIVRINVAYENEKVKDPMVVYFSDAASPEFDSDLDALKLMNTDMRVPNLYGLSSDAEKLSINAVPYPFDSITRIPLGIKTSKTAWLTFTASEIGNIPLGLRVYLSDEATGLIQDLEKSPKYRLQLQNGTFENRFVLLFSDRDLAKIPKEKDTFYASLTNGRLSVFVELATGKNATLIISNMLGQVMLKKDINGNGTYDIVQNLPAGVYVLTLYSQKGIQSHKLYIPNL
jgi:hypothetical protein